MATVASTRPRFTNGSRLAGRACRDQRPVGIAAACVARDRPDVRDLGDPGRVALDHLALFVAHHVDLLGNELNRNERGPRLQLGLDDLGFEDADQGGFQGMPGGLALGNGAGEIAIDVIREQRPQRLGNSDMLAGRALS